MLTIKKGQTVKSLVDIKVGDFLIKKDTLLVIVKGGDKEPYFITTRNDEPLMFSMKMKNKTKINELFYDVPKESKMEKELSHITYKKVKFFETMDGCAFSADIYIHKKKIAEIRDDGHGGETFIQLYDEKCKELLEENAKLISSISGEKFTRFSGNAYMFEILFNYINSNSSYFLTLKEVSEKHRIKMEEMLKED